MSDAFHQPEPVTPPKKPVDKAADNILRVMMLIISTVSLGIAMLGLAYVALQYLLWDSANVRENIWAIVFVIGLAYVVGWAVALVGIRHFNNLVLPGVINIYAWATLAGIAALYIIILFRLYEQRYFVGNFIKYTIVMWVAIAGLIGFHLLIEDHNLRPFSIPLLMISLVHLYLIVFHYVFAIGKVNYDYLSGDIIFFLGMALVSVLMLLHVGTLSWLRNSISGIFETEEMTDFQNTEG